MKKVVFIGNRPKVFEVIRKNKRIELVRAFIIEQPLIEDTIDCKIERLPSKGQKNKLINYLKNLDYDICISAGCSYILPMRELPENKLFINCHPSVLPYGKGIHPLNECFLSGNNVAGVTIHLLVDELDAGDILNQVKFNLTDEIDVSVLYGFIFDLEAELLEDTINKIIDNKMHYKAVPQKGKGSYYSREKNMRVFLAKDVTVKEIVNNTRAFASTNLGIKLVTTELELIIYSTQVIVNEFLLDRYKSIKSGRLLFKNDDVVLVKLLDGIIKINKFKIIKNKSLNV